MTEQGAQLIAAACAGLLVGAGFASTVWWQSALRDRPRPSNIVSLDAYRARQAPTRKRGT